VSPLSAETLWPFDKLPVSGARFWRISGAFASRRARPAFMVARRLAPGHGFVTPSVRRRSRAEGRPMWSGLLLSWHCDHADWRRRTIARRRGRRTNPAHRKMSVAGHQRCPNVPRQIVQGDRSEGASGPPDASISEGEWTRCRIAPAALVCATASVGSDHPAWGAGTIGFMTERSSGSDAGGSSSGDCASGESVAGSPVGAGARTR
jgi:hypothetical protein